MVKCFYCKKKISIGMEIKCKCNNLFCIKHKLSEDHKCPYNYKLYGRKKIIENNPRIINNKIIKI